MKKKLILLSLAILLINFVGVVSSEDFNSSPFTELIESDNSTKIFSDFGSREEYTINSKNYSLSSTTYYIRFEPSLPSSVCENEKIDITVRGKARFYPDSKDLFDCAWQDYTIVHWCLNLMEDDFLSRDDEIKSICQSSKSYDCSSFYFEYTFRDVDLSSEFGGVEDQGTIEVYAEIYDFDNKVGRKSTTVYDVGKVECNCLSGACCDTSSRPYNFKPYGSQPKGYTDEYICSGKNTPEGTNWVYKIDYYCNGQSSSVKSTNIQVDTCGTCEYCTTGDSTCNYYSSSTTCGTKDCDYLDTSCRDYHDIDKKCVSGGRCEATTSCYSSYTNKPKHTSCGTGKECDGKGNCITCTSHFYTSCYDNDVYWYDKCNNRQEKKEECGEDFCDAWFTDTCHGNDVYETRTCYRRGCRAGDQGPHCYKDAYEEERYVKTCQWGCTNGRCNPNPNVKCYKDSDCPRVYSNPSCYGDDVKKDYTDYKCENPGTEQSYCKEIYNSSAYYDCGEDEYGSNYCYDGDVYRDFIDRGCSNGNCFETTIKQKVEECGLGGCENGQCKSEPECSETDTSCGIYPNCVNCNLQDGCEGDYYKDYYCVNNSKGCSYDSDDCSDCSCSCGGYNVEESIANDNCNDGKDNDCDGQIDLEDAGCPSDCQNECVFGSIKCVDNVEMFCGDFDNDDCTEWGGKIICEYGCSNNKCSPCVDECVPGDTRCVGNMKQACGYPEWDYSRCAKWLDLVECPNGCSDGKCIGASCTDECVYLSKKCSSKFDYVIENNCIDSDKDTCTEWCNCGLVCGEECSDGVCGGFKGCEDKCNFGDMRCLYNKIQICADYNFDGCYEWGGNTYCDLGCENGECLSIYVLEGDVNKDCKVDIFDLAKVGLCYNQQAKGDCKNADLNNDGTVNIFDLAIIGLNYGKTC